ncbi:MAG TPA: PAS domain S-box protein, partial [Gammaproteobacteria bacterium]|nr:PAS domain S-box protein [Gammaproteobacteria bacterium]
AKEGLRLALRGALSEAAKERRKVVREGLLLDGDSAAALVALTVQPMPQLGEDQPLFLVVFRDVPSFATEQSGEEAAPSSQEVATIIDQLEQELETARNDLEKTVQELESANEELKSSNEELLSMNEELQSANEELQTSQDELRAANDSLMQLNDDLENLLASTQIATIFLDDEQRIRRVTEAAQAIYNVRKSDAGRALADFTHCAETMPRLPSRGLLTAADKPIEDEVEMRDGKTYLRRVMPYTTQQGTPEGTLVTFIDITERRRVEDRLRASEALYRAIGESIDYGVWVCDPEGRSTYVSESLLKLVGLSQDEWRKFGWGKILHPEESERHLTDWEECVRTGSTWDAEYRFRGADGEWHPILARGVPVRDAAGAITCWAGINLDISRQKRTEDALRESEQRFRLVANAAPVFIWMSGLDKQCTWFNRGWLEFTGRTLEHELGRGWTVGVHPDDRQRTLHTYESSFDRREPFVMEFRLRRHDGEYRWVLENGVPLHAPGGEFIGYIGSCVDNHDRRQAEAALRESEQRFRTLADSAPVLIWVSGLEGYEYVNREFLRYTGEDLDGVRGMRWAEALFPDDASDYLGEYKETFRKQTRFEAFARLRRHDGEYRWMQSVGLPRYSGSGEFLGYVGCSLDVTEIKQAEEALIEVDRRKDEFLAMLAHELRNPLGAIVNANLVLAQPDLAEPTRQWAHEVVERQAGHLTKIVDDLLDLSRISSGKIRLQKKPTDVVEVLKRAVEGVRSSFEHKRQRLAVEFPEAPLPVQADPARLEQIFVNLLANANKYTNAEGDISVSAFADRGQAVVRVKDTGIGVPKAMLARIFEAFTQADDSLDRAQGGVGLGLTVVKHLVEEHDGSVSVESEGPGRGSEFAVRLPMRSGPDPACESPKTGVSRTRAKSRRVLLVEDNADNAGTMSLLLQEAGHAVEIVRNGLEALRIARRFRPDVVLLDLGLPGMNGYAVAEGLRKESECAKCVIIAVSGYGQERDRKRSRAAGIDRHFTKPVDVGELLAAIANR